MDAEWILCPLCGGKTRDKIREDTVLVNYLSNHSHRLCFVLLLL